MKTSPDWQYSEGMPSTATPPSPPPPPALAAAIARSRKLLNRRALGSAAAAATPLPGLDWAVDAALLTRLIPAINAQFSLTPEQIQRLPDQQRSKLERAVALVGSNMIGKKITHGLVMQATKSILMRVTTAKAARFIPIVGQAVSAAVSYATLRYLGEAHIQDCARVWQTAGLALPAPSEPEPKLEPEPKVASSDHKKPSPLRRKR